MDTSRFWPSWITILHVKTIYEPNLFPNDYFTLNTFLGIFKFYMELCFPGLNCIAKCDECDLSTILFWFPCDFCMNIWKFLIGPSWLLHMMSQIRCIPIGLLHMMSQDTYFWPSNWAVAYDIMIVNTTDRFNFLF